MKNIGIGCGIFILICIIVAVLSPQKATDKNKGAQKDSAKTVRSSGKNAEKSA